MRTSCQNSPHSSRPLNERGSCGLYPEGASEKQVICDLVCKLFEFSESDSTDLLKGSDLVRIDYSDSKNSAYLQYANGRRKAVVFAGTDKKEMLVHLVNAIAETDD